MALSCTRAAQEIVSTVAEVQNKNTFIQWSEMVVVETQPAQNQIGTLQLKIMETNIKNYGDLSSFFCPLVSGIRTI